MKVIIFFFAGLIGVFFVKAFFFDNIEHIAWNMFWNTIANGNSKIFSVGIFNSATFLKSFFGFGIFGFAGLFGYNHYYEKNQIKKRK